MKTWILTPLLLAAIALGYAGCLAGLAVLCHVAGPVGLGAGLFAVFAALSLGTAGRCWAWHGAARRG